MACAALLTIILSLSQAPAAPAEPLVSSRIEDRVVKRFDFDERRLGNYESIPQFWLRMTEPEFPGYPRFLEPRFDFDVGHTAPPSFRFDLNDGNIGARYISKDINVHPLADYRVTAWVKTQGLEHARAYLTAYYLDHALRKIEKSERQSEFVQDAGRASGWARIDVHLPGGFDRARWIGLSCRVEQAPKRVGTVQELRPINYRDIRAIVWFDDITIVRLPRVGVELETHGAVFPAEREAACTVRVADLDGAGIRARLDVYDAELQPAGSHEIPAVGLDDIGVRVALGDLGPGRYTAQLTVEVDGTPIVKFAQPFLKLGHDLRRGDGVIREFGVNFEPLAGASEADQRYLLEQLSAGVVKAPLWRRDVSDAEVLWGDYQLGGLLKSLSDSGVEIVALLEDPPGTLAEQYGHPDLTLLDVLSSSPEQWRPYLALMLARYGPYIRAWQVGADDRPILRSDRRLAAAVSNVRTELHPLIGASDLSGPREIYDRRGAKALPAEIVAVAAPSTMSAEGVGRQLSSLAGDDMPRRWATIELPARDRYDRRSRLVEFARRVVVVLQSGAETVFIPQPWETREQGGTKIMSPLEEFILYRTLTQVLGGTRPITPVWLDHGVHGWLFGTKGSEDGALVIWSDGDEPRPRGLSIDIDEGARQVDLWGNVGEMPRGEGGRTATIEAMPTIVRPVSAARLRTMAGFSIDTPDLRPDVLEQFRTLTLTNSRGIQMHGKLTLKAPRGWQIHPRQHAVDLDPGETGEFEIRILVPTNQAVGNYTLRGRLALEGDPLDGLRVQLPLKIAVPELDVGVAARTDGDRLIIRHRITNRTEESLNLRGVLIAPGFPRQVRIVQHLAPGQTAVRHFEIEDAAALSGKRCRVSVEQVDGRLRQNQLIGID